MTTALRYLDILLPWVAGAICLALHLTGHMSPGTLSTCLASCWGASDARETYQRRRRDQGGS